MSTCTDLSEHNHSLEFTTSNYSSMPTVKHKVVFDEMLRLRSSLASSQFDYDMSRVSTGFGSANSFDDEFRHNTSNEKPPFHQMSDNSTSK